MKKITDIKAVVFDMDGVIFDTERIYAAAWYAVAKDLQVPNIEAALEACTGANNAAIRRYFAQHYQDITLFDRFWAERDKHIYATLDREGLPYKPHARELLAYLKVHGYRIALATSTAKPRTERYMTASGIAPLFDEIVTGDQIANGKPAPDIYLYACEKLGVKPQQAVGIEDSHNGVRSVFAAGLHPIMVPDRMPVTAEMQNLVDAICPTLAEVENLLRAQERN